MEAGLQFIWTMEAGLQINRTRSYYRKGSAALRPKPWETSLLRFKEQCNTIFNC